MLFGQSVFQSVLERLKVEEEEVEETADPSPAAHRIRGLNSGFAASVLEGVSAASHRVDQAYFDMIEPELAAPVETPVEPDVPEPEPPMMPEHLTRIGVADVAEELAISANDTPAGLAEKRRMFAKSNHPDGVLPAFRDNANMRMKIANLLIDEAIRRLSR
jgi:hypothetical protein